MKTGIGIYGKVIITIIIIMTLFSLVAFNNPSNVFSKVVQPKSTVNNYQESQIGQMIQKRDKPVLTVHPVKIPAGFKCDLTDVRRFNIISKNADNVTIPFSIIKIMKDNIELPITNEITPERGVYQVTYQNSEVYKGVKRETKVTYNFVVD